MTQAVVIEIVVGVPQQKGNALALRTAETTTHDYAATLIDDLELPARAVVRAEAVAGERFTLVLAGADAVFNATSARDLPLALYRNRRLFVTPAVTVAFGAARWTETLSSYASGKLQELIIACVERNLRLGRLAVLLRGLHPGDLWDTWDLVSRVHREPHLAIRIDFGAQVRDFDDFDAEAADVQRRLFEGTGLLCPLPWSSEALVAADEWRLCLNDVRLPLRRRRAEDPGAGTAILAELTHDPELLLTRDGIARRIMSIEETRPALVRESVPRVGPNPLIAILGALVRSGASIRDLERILDELTVPLVPYELADGAYQIVSSPVDLTSRRKPGEGKREATPDEYAAALALRLQQARE
ncbi:MAG TPA: hypothetical protein VNI54_05535 [Thermoanaerobaculia bacterium]|nr:hypothetical protein [Thermoanaerobaculia bacterium]